MKYSVKGISLTTCLILWEIKIGFCFDDFSLEAKSPSGSIIHPVQKVLDAKATAIATSVPSKNSQNIFSPYRQSNSSASSSSQINKNNAKRTDKENREHYKIFYYHH